MHVSSWVWVITIAGLVALILLDLVLVDRKPHEVKTKEAALWVLGYVTLAVLFGIGLAVVSGGRYAGEFFAGYLTEYSLSVDNLFVFVIIMGAFAVPKIHQHRVLLIGIVLALIMRGGFIALGAAVISIFEWVFFLFGAFLIYTGWKLAFRSGGSGDFSENGALRLLRRVIPVTDDYHGAKTVVRIDGMRLATPMLIVMIAIGTSDLLFALDSIPAIFGLTKEPYLVFAANAFALMGLRQLYFLIGGLLDRLVYLSIGLSVILAFIGVKLILEALPSVGVTGAPHIGIGLSLGVIAAVLLVTVVASLRRSRRDAEAARQKAEVEAGAAATSAPTDRNEEE